MSRLRPVGSMLPCENCWATLLSLTPEPIALRARPYEVYENRSANSARDSLKPAVLTLAMLLAVTFRSALAALMPDSEVLKLMADSVECCGMTCVRGGRSDHPQDVVDRRGADALQVEVEAVVADGDALDAAADVGFKVGVVAGGVGMARGDGIVARRQ